MSQKIRTPLASLPKSSKFQDTHLWTPLSIKILMLDSTWTLKRLIIGWTQPKSYKRLLINNKSSCTTTTKNKVVSVNCKKNWTSLWSMSQRKVAVQDQLTISKKTIWKQLIINRLLEIYSLLQPILMTSCQTFLRSLQGWLVMLELDIQIRQQLCRTWICRWLFLKAL